MTPQQVQEEVKKSGLRGRGGAGFPTGVKWSFTPMGTDAPRPKYVIANADEMEPGTFKDRFLMEGDPHQLIDGLILAGYANQADVAYIFIRGEYKLSQERLARAIAEAYAARYLGKNILNSGYGLEMYLHVSAGGTCAARRRDCSTRWRASAPTRARNRHSRRCRDSGAGRPS